MFYDRLLSIRKAKLVDLNNKVTPLRENDEKLRVVRAEVTTLQSETTQVIDLIDKRFFWTDVLTQFRSVFTNAESKAEGKFKTDVGLWIEAFRPVVPGYSVADEETNEEMDPEMLKRYGIQKKTGEVSKGNTIEIIKLQCRGINIDRLRPGANNELIYLLVDEIKAHPEFFNLGDKGTNVILGAVNVATREDLTFTFDLQVTLKKSYKL
jgi:hypothetical protein